MMDRHWAILPKWIFKRWLIVIVNNSKKYFIQIIYTIIWLSDFLICTIQTKIQWKISLRFCVVQETWTYKFLLKHLNFYQLFCIDSKHIRQNSNFCQWLFLIVFFLLNSQILVFPILVHTISWLCPDSRKWHLPWFNLI